MPPIDIVIPVYNAAADLERCVESVLANTAGEFTLVLIDDASTDPAIAAYFAALARRALPPVRLLRNDTNLGFTGTANRGFARSRADVVLLNSDTIVTRGWLDALTRCARSDPAIGTITPFSNNAEICSYPRFCENNPWPADADPEPVRAALAHAAVPSHPELPTGVGFCLYVRRALLDAIGAFDAAFGHGYGEENDFCLRAAKAGFRNVLCDDAFVVHVGERSFEGRKAELGVRNMALLLERHPHYLDLVHAYIATDPLAPIRAAARAQQRVAASPGRGVLQIVHGHGGGTEHHARALVEASRKRYRHYLATAVGDAWEIEEHRDDGTVERYQFVRTAAEPWSSFVGGLCATFGIGLVHLHNLSGARDGIIAALAELAIPYGYTLHDLNFACPTITFLAADGMYCGAQTDPAVCRGCLAAQPSFASIDIVAWRERHRAVLAGARFLIAPSRWVAQTVARYFPGAAVEVVPLAAASLFGAAVTGNPEIPAPDPQVPLPPLPEDGIPTVAVLGAIGPDKGARRVERLVELVRSNAVPLRFVLIGYLDRLQVPSRSADSVFTLHGRYSAHDLPALLAHYRARLVAFPSSGPETFSFTLSEAWAAGRPVVVPPIGALAERVAGSGAGWVLDEAEWIDDERMLRRIAEIVAPENAARLAAAAAQARQMPQQTPEAMAQRSLAFYDAALAAAPAAAALPAPLAPSRVLQALGYRPWRQPLAVEAAPAPEAAGSSERSHGALATGAARLAIRWGNTPLGRALRRVTPAPVLAAIKARLF
jgi:GT2 family glycosyltransferase/glycosyltransferase involved in cell wall biosynthesis